MRKKAENEPIITRVSHQSLDSVIFMPIPGIFSLKNLFFEIFHGNLSVEICH